MDRQQLDYLLKKHHLQARRESSQNFLVNDQVVEKLIQSADVNDQNIVLEIGPGLGAVTAELCKIAKKVIAVEQDWNFLPVLNNLAKANKNLEIINQDIFKVDFNFLKNKNFKIVTSLPFNITSIFFRYFLEHGPRPQVISAIIQKEVAERIIAQEGGHSLLSLSIQMFGEPKIEKIVSKNCFFPKPRVDCAILSLKNIGKPVEISDLKAFFRFLRVGFSAKRKKLSNNLENGLKISKPDMENVLVKLGLTPNARAQELTLKSWIGLFDHLRKYVL